MPAEGMYGRPVLCESDPPTTPNLNALKPSVSCIARPSFRACLASETAGDVIEARHLDLGRTPDVNPLGAFLRSH
jgi:hypothetical protein